MKILPREALTRVTPIALRAYLKRHGKWQQAETMANGAGVFFEAAGREEAILLLHKMEFGDYADRMAENITVLAAHEGREPDNVLQDLLASCEDIIRVHVDSSSGGSLPLATVATVLRDTRSLLLAAARSTERPERKYTAKPGREIQEYMSSLRFGQTERGSLVVPVYSPIPSDSTDGDSNVEDQLSRRVVTTFVTALTTAHDLVGGDMAYWHERTLETEVAQGISANLCTALSNLLKVTDGFTLSVDWALAFRPPGENYSVRFEIEHVYRIEEIQRTLELAVTDSSVVGTVIGLSWNIKDRKGQAKVRARVNGSFRTVYLDELSRHDYTSVLEAHKEQRKVAASGRLIGRGRAWHLAELRKLTTDYTT